MVSFPLDTLDKAIYNMNTEVDNYPVTELQRRYSVGKQTVYNRLDRLDIKPFKEKRRSYVTADQVRLLDELHRHIVSGKTMADFQVTTIPVELSMTTLARDRMAAQFMPLGSRTFYANDEEDEDESLVDSSTFPVDSGLVHISAIKELVKAIASVLGTQDPIHYMNVLERAAASNWILSTSEVKALIGVKPRLKKGSYSFSRGCWVFTASGKVGSQTGWKVCQHSIFRAEKSG